jgi:hypothetical protein
MLQKEVAPRCYDHPGHGQAMALAGEVSIAQALFFALSPPRARVMIRHVAGGECCFSLEGRIGVVIWAHNRNRSRPISQHLCLW